VIVAVVLIEGASLPEALHFLEYLLISDEERRITLLEGVGSIVWQAHAD
jgi:hypothetical protein